MQEAIHKKNIIKNKDIKRKEEKAIIQVNNGECYLQSDVDVMGIQLEFKGKAEITPTLPDGWILQGNNRTIIMFCLSKIPIKNQKLFEYVGYVDIRKAVISNDKGERLTELIERGSLTWGEQTFEYTTETSSWENFKNNKIKGKVKKTSYNLPDYNLPEVKNMTKKRIKNREKQLKIVDVKKSSSRGY